MGCGQCAAVCTTGAITVKTRSARPGRPSTTRKTGWWSRSPRPSVWPGRGVRPARRRKRHGPAGHGPEAHGRGRGVRHQLWRGYDHHQRGRGVPGAAERRAVPHVHQLLPRLGEVSGVNDPKYLRNISTCKSPMEMFAAVIRTTTATRAQQGTKTYVVAIMPCTAKKMEAARPEFRPTVGRTWIWC